MNTIIKSKTLFDNSSKLIISRIEKFVKKENDYKKRIEELERDNEQLKIELNYKNQIKKLTIENEELKMKNKNLIASVQTDEIFYYNRIDENGNLYIREADYHIKELEETIKSLDENMTELANEYSAENDELKEKIKKLTKELKESKKTIKGLKKLDGCWLTRQWICDQAIESKDTTTSFKDLFNYYESWVELVYGKNMKVDKVAFKDYIMKYQKVYFGWDDVINGTYTNPKINIIIRDE